MEYAPGEHEEPERKRNEGGSEDPPAGGDDPRPRVFVGVPTASTGPKPKSPVLELFSPSSLKNERAIQYPKSDAVMPALPRDGVVAVEAPPPKRTEQQGNDDRESAPANCTASACCGYAHVDLSKEVPAASQTPIAPDVARTLSERRA
jgi:hypothetical protein